MKILKAKEFISTSRAEMEYLIEERMKLLMQLPLLLGQIQGEKLMAEKQRMELFVLAPPTHQKTEFRKLSIFILPINAGLLPLKRHLNWIFRFVYKLSPL